MRLVRFLVSVSGTDRSWSPGDLVAFTDDAEADGWADGDRAVTHERQDDAPTHWWPVPPSDPDDDQATDGDNPDGDNPDEPDPAGRGRKRRA